MVNLTNRSTCDHNLMEFMPFDKGSLLKTQQGRDEQPIQPPAQD